MKKESKTIIVMDYEKKGYSIYGNPSYIIYMIDATTQEFLKGQTTSNSSAGYENWTTYQYKKTPLKIYYHYTKKGNLKIDRVERA